MVTGGRGGDSYVVAHVESPAVIPVVGVLTRHGRSRGVRGIDGSRGGGEDDDRLAPSGRGRRPSLRDFSSSRLRSPPDFFLLCDSSEVVEQDRSAW